jgi:hypothetical protein
VVRVLSINRCEYRSLFKILTAQLTKDTVLETNYAGTFGHRLIGILNYNTYPGRLACSAPPTLLAHLVLTPATRMDSMPDDRIPISATSCFAQTAAIQTS